VSYTSVQVPLAVGGLGMISTTNYRYEIFLAGEEYRYFPTLLTDTNLPALVLKIETTLRARCYGVRSAMPGFIGVKLCKQEGADLVFVKPNHAKYTEESRKIYESEWTNVDSYIMWFSGLISLS
jgi:heme-degrading monooxygenase HmoA